MVESFKRLFRMSIFTSIFFIALGLFLVIKPDTTITAISYIIGGIIMVTGITFLIKYFSNREQYGLFSGDLIFGVLSIVIGLVLILNPTALAKVIPFIIGVWILISSVTKIEYSMQLKSIDNRAWVYTMIIAIITFIWGLLLIFDPFGGAMAITQIIGIFILVYAILDFIEIFIIRKNLKDIKKEVKEAIKIIEEK
ncbi:MAG: hypothetical protein HFH31_00770 [Bacilli bacterium]|nr:hypothetical protein [Bacilli bacterium]